MCGRVQLRRTVRQRTLLLMRRAAVTFADWALFPVIVLVLFLVSGSGITRDELQMLGVMTATTLVVRVAIEVGKLLWRQRQVSAPR